MLLALSTLWRSITSKAALYGAVALAVLFAVFQVFSAGQTKERLKQAETKIKETKQNAEIKSRIDSLAASDARDRLLRDWSSR